MSREATKLVLGRGEVYFDRFLPGTLVGDGERYLGNTTSFRIQREVERLKRATSYRGLKINKLGAIISESHEVNFVTDHVDVANVSTWFGGSTPQTTGAAYEDVSETFSVQHGRFYQLGNSRATMGLRNVAYLGLFRNGNLVPMENNYILNEAQGRIGIIKGAPAIPNGSLITVAFQVRASEEYRFTSSTDSVQGSLRFISNNEGPISAKVQNDLFFPYVTISPRGQIDLKADEWQQWGFDVTAMNLSPSHAQVYITHSAGWVGNAADDQAIIDEFGSMIRFPYWEDRLHYNVNYEWPDAMT